MICNDDRKPVIDPRKDHTSRTTTRGQRCSDEEKEPQEVRKDVPPAQLGGVHILVNQVQVWCRRCGQDAPTLEPPADPERRLLQPTVVAESYAPDACSPLAHVAPHCPNLPLLGPPRRPTTSRIIQIGRIRNGVTRSKLHQVR